jgi:hypothetical protein
MSHYVVRFLWLFLLGALLTPVAGYIGVFLFGWIVLFWLIQLVLFLVGAGVPPQFVDHFFWPALYGIKWAWPTTCVLFPVAGAYWSQSNMLTPLVFSIFGLICGLATISIVAVIDPQSIAPAEKVYFITGGSFAGAIIGALFGFALWRIDSISKRRLRTSAGGA